MCARNMHTSFLTKKQKVLLVDDDQNVLDLYRELLAKLPMGPEIHVADSGKTAIELLETDQYSLLVSDLRMADVDGFQLLAIVRRRFPHLRSVVMTGLNENHFRSRAYALGVDLFLKKPTAPKEWEMFCDSLDWLLQSEAAGGFRGMQTKSLVDIIQLECLSRYSSTLRVSTGQQEGWIWFDSGEVIDAAQAEYTGEDAFRRILSWQRGGFEILPPDKGRTRTIFHSYHSLLLETAQVIDEGQDIVPELNDGQPAEPGHISGVNFMVSADGPDQVEGWGVENANEVAEWTRKTMERFTSFGLELQLGPVAQIEGVSGNHQIVMVYNGPKEVCLGIERSLGPERLKNILEEVLTS